MKKIKETTLWGETGKSGFWAFKAIFSKGELRFFGVRNGKRPLCTSAGKPLAQGKIESKIMEKLKQLGVILGITFVSELLYRLLGLPVPASVYGLVILFLVLQTGALKPERVEGAGDFLLVCLPLLFIAPGVNLMNIFDEVKSILLEALALIFISTVVVTVVTGKVADLILTKEQSNE